ncbi:MAG TPA: thiosulfate oxidation carrier protein SoxY [Gammaproteobacteria bacterium]
MNMKRRVFLKGTVASGAVAVAVGAGLLNPRQVLAAWPKSAFEAKSVSDVLKGIYESDLAPASSDITVDAPDIAENGAVVPVTVTTSLSNVESITILSEKNNTPLVATFNMTPAAEGYISTRIKMGQSSNVIAVVKADGKLHSARKEVKVTIGGCGG